MLKNTFTDPEWKQDLQDAGYSDFDTWWNAEGDLVVEGNLGGKDERQSWSHVTRVQMPNGKTIYLKRQQNHYPTNFLNRVRGLLTFQLNPLSPPLRSPQQRPQGHPEKSKFLAVVFSVSA
jgi:hypothetical protein